MGKFIRENSAIIVKFILTHIVMSVLGIMVGLAVITIESDVQGISAIALIGSLFTIGFMCFMHYDDMFFVAVKEGIRARSEGTVIDKLKGLKITLIAYSPVILVGLVAIITDLFFGDTENASAITLLIYYAFQGSYLALYKLRIMLGVIGYVLITLIPAIVASSLGYYFGVQDKTLRGSLGMDVKPPFDGPLERKPKDKNKK